MGLFFDPRKNKTKWASIVMADTKSGVDIPIQVLEQATKIYIEQHLRILNESLNLVMSSKNKKTREGRLDLARKEYGALIKVKKYATRNEKKHINKAINDFIRVEDNYKHPNKLTEEQRRLAKKQNKDDFWRGVAEVEFIDDFMDDIFGK